MVMRFGISLPRFLIVNNARLPVDPTQYLIISLSLPALPRPFGFVQNGSDTIILSLISARGWQVMEENPIRESSLCMTIEIEAVPFENLEKWPSEQSRE